MKFDVEERLTALGLLPKEGTLITMKIVHELRQALAFSEEDLAILNFRQEDDRLMWNNGVAPKEIKVGFEGTKVFREELEKLDKGGKLRESHLLLVDKFEYKG